MARNWKDVRNPASEARVQRFKEAAKIEGDLYELSLREMREARELTQVELAKTLKVSQAQVSRIEKQSEMYLSTLRSYVEAMGGSLELVSVFGDRRVKVDLGDVTDEWQPA